MLNERQRAAKDAATAHFLASLIKKPLNRLTCFSRYPIKKTPRELSPILSTRFWTTIIARPGRRDLRSRLRAISIERETETRQPTCLNRECTGLKHVALGPSLQRCAEPLNVISGRES